MNVIPRSKKAAKGAKITLKKLDIECLCKAYKSAYMDENLIDIACDNAELNWIRMAVSMLREMLEGDYDDDIQEKEPFLLDLIIRANNKDDENDN